MREMIPMARYIVFCAALILAVCSPASADVKRFNVSEEGSPVIGPGKADVTIIEFIDYQ